MSDSIHITIKNFRNLTKAELEEQYNDPESELAQWAKKSGIKRTVKKSRNEKTQIEQLRKLINTNLDTKD
tara:strand:+ start:522 stop:731 length:210 start_codon:yes stop_codon:yes gene_type:complete